MATYPEDRFDHIPHDLRRVGAHRAPNRRVRGWITVAWAGLATLVLILAGVVWLSTLDNQANVSLPFLPSSGESSSSPTPTAAAPVLDPKIAITILNGTEITGLASRAGDELVAKGWNGVGAKTNANQRDVPVTFVYFRDPAHEGAARGVVRDLGVGQVQLSEAFDSPITVVLGADYKR